VLDLVCSTPYFILFVGTLPSPLCFSKGFLRLYTGGMLARCFLFFTSLIFPLLLPFAFAEGVVVSGDGGASLVMMDGMKGCLVEDGGREDCYASLCEYEPGYLCAEEILDVATEIAGPERAMEVLHELMASPVFAITTDGHLLSHIIGRATSRVFGSSGENFLLCPHDFNDGCYHGFFEDTLVKVDDPVRVAVAICEGMPESTSDKEKSYCYHGAGHVFLMQESYDLGAALKRCVAVPDAWVGSCLGGLFMENAWPSRSWEMKKKNFRQDDPLYPCNTVEDRFKPPCYAEHYSYLMHTYTDSLDGLVRLCMGAGEYARDCIGGLANMLQNPSRVDALATHFGVEDLAYMDKVIFLCGQFPEAYQEVCPTFLVAAILNFDYPDLSRLVVFCEGIDVRYRSLCFRRAGRYMSSLGGEVVKREACATLPVAYRDICLDNDSGVKRAGAAVVSSGDGGRLGRVVGQVVHFLGDLFGSLAILFARPVSAQVADDSASPDGLLSEVERCRHQSDDRAACYASLCEYDPGYLCAERILEAVTREVRAGPEVGMQILGEMVASPLFDLSIGDSGHSLAHVVGRATARYIGMDGEAFLRCPTSFDYGCVHGFLEISLAESASPADAIAEVCESLPDKPAIGKPNCYHGSGHGVMMHASYNLDEALAICDQLPDSYACWGGVFMENSSGYNRILALYPEHNSFDAHDLLAPCSVVDEKYRTACFRVHILYLGRALQYDLDAVIATCLGAGDYTEDCVIGFGWHILFEDLQNSFLPGTAMNFIEKTIYLCNMFPERYRGVCYRPAINQITVSYGAERTFEFCEKVEEQYAPDCYQEIGRRLGDLILHQDEKEEACASVPGQYRDDCLGRGAYDGFFAEEHAAGDQEVRSDPEDTFFSRAWRFLKTAFQYVVVTFAREARAHDGDGVSAAPLIAVDQYANPTIRSGLGKCLTLSTGRGECYASLCEGVGGAGYICAEHLVYEVVALRDVTAGIAVIQEIVGTPAFDMSDAHVFGQHQLAHIAGRSASRHHGGTSDIFIQCPVTFDYGCHHGFFEAALQGGSLSPAEVLFSICASDDNTIQNDTANCYHGGGHGVMMDAAYDLDEALRTCDALPDFFGVSGCYGGVFMESGKGFIEGRVPDAHDRYYHADDLLAPCNSLAERYRGACYSSHFMYYVQYVTSVSLQNLVSLCRGAGDDFGICISGASRLFIEGPQDQVLRASGSPLRGDVVEKTIYLCNQLPAGYRGACHMFLVSYYMDDLNSRSGRLEKAVRYCVLLDARYQEDCYRQVRERLHDFTAAVEQKMDFCADVSEKYRGDCLRIWPGLERRGGAVADSAPGTVFAALHDFFMRMVGYVLAVFS